MFEKTLTFCLLCCFPFLGNAQSQESPALPVSTVQATFEYGAEGVSAYKDAGFESPVFTIESEPHYQSKKSPLLAGVLSAVVPGAGDVYAGNYIMASVFLAAEAVGWYYNIDQNKQGDDQTAFYEDYADNHWSAVKYAEFLNAHASEFDGGDGAPQIPISSDASLSHWERVDWAVMNEVEMMIPVFSHRLPAHGEQQYYELIGKYDQYSYGWDDKDATGDVTIDYRNISDNFRYYSEQRGKANDFYNTASTIASLIILNHALAAANAIWSVARFNKRIELQSHVELLPFGTYGHVFVPTATFKYRF